MVKDTQAGDILQFMKDGKNILRTSQSFNAAKKPGNKIQFYKQYTGRCCVYPVHHTKIN